MERNFAEAAKFIKSEHETKHMVWKSEPIIGLKTDDEVINRKSRDLRDAGRMETWPSMAARAEQQLRAMQEREREWNAAKKKRAAAYGQRSSFFGRKRDRLLLFCPTFGCTIQILLPIFWPVRKRHGKKNRLAKVSDSTRSVASGEKDLCICRIKIYRRYKPYNFNFTIEMFPNRDLLSCEIQWVLPASWQIIHSLELGVIHGEDVRLTTFHACF